MRSIAICAVVMVILGCRNLHEDSQTRQIEAFADKCAAVKTGDTFEMVTERLAPWRPATAAESAAASDWVRQHGLGLFPEGYMTNDIFIVCRTNMADGVLMQFRHGRLVNWLPVKEAEISEQSSRHVPK